MNTPVRDSVPSNFFAYDVTSAVTKDECQALAMYAKNRAVLELGSYHGRSTIALASTARVVHSVDHHQGDEFAGHGFTLPSFMRNLERYEARERVVVHVGSFDAVLPFLRPAAFELIFIDGAHDRESILRDVRLCYPLGFSPTVWAFHDYGRFDVAKALEELRFPIVAQVGSLAICRGI